MALSKGMVEEIQDYCRKNLTQVPAEVDQKMADLYKKYHKSAFYTIEKGIELKGLQDKLEEVKQRELKCFEEFFNCVMEAPCE